MYTVQMQAEWSGMDDLCDLDFEAEDMDAVERIIRDEIPTGCIYQVFDEDWNLVEESTK